MPTAVKSTLTDKFASRLREEIAAGRFSVEKPLPSERVLAEKYRISRVTVRRSLRLLCGERLIEARPARGYFVVPGAPERRRRDEARAVLFVQRGTTEGPMLDSMHTRIVNGALAEAHGLGLEVYILCQDLPDFVGALRQQWGQRLRGVLLDWARPELARGMLAAGVPFVVVETDLEGLEVASVVQDNPGGIRAAMEHLHGLGHSRVALITGTPDESVHVRERIGGYREFLLRRGLQAPAGMVLSESLDADGGRRAAAAALSCAQPATAFLVCHREMLPGVLEELDERALACPKDISLVVWGEPEPGETGPGAADLTHVAWDKQEMGRLAVRALEERIRLGRLERMLVRVETRLVDRGSTGSPRTEGGSR
jgi:LacI family transcriptional regulator